MKRLSRKGKSVLIILVIVLITIVLISTITKNKKEKAIPTNKIVTGNTAITTTTTSGVTTIETTTSGVTTIETTTTKINFGNASVSYIEVNLRAYPQIDQSGYDNVIRQLREGDRIKVIRNAKTVYQDNIYWQYVITEDGTNGWITVDAICLD